jgi:hypothetical protein
MVGRSLFPNPSRGLHSSITMLFATFRSTNSPVAVTADLTYVNDAALGSEFHYHCFALFLMHFIAPKPIKIGGESICLYSLYFSTTPYFGDGGAHALCR